MLNKESKAYMIFFAAAVCIVCSMLLTFVTAALSDKKDQNRAFDRKKNIIKVFGHAQAMEEAGDFESINKFYNEHVRELAVSLNGVVEQGLKADDDIARGVNEDSFPVYVWEKEGKITSYAVPIEGKGLWSTIYGYLALEKDLNTVKGITFYEHGETPGLGGEIETPWFQNNFIGKKILDENGELAGISVVKGKAEDMFKDDPDKIVHAVDGISGATMTSNGITKLIYVSLAKYTEYFKRIRER